MRTVAITGVSGYLGRKLVSTLETGGDVSRIIGIDIKAPDYSARTLEFYETDVRSPELASVIAGAEVLVHLAFSAESRDRDEMRDVNVGGTRVVLESAAKADMRKVVFVSTSAVYGAHPDNDFPVTEGSALRPIESLPHSSHKAEAEEIVAAFGESHPQLTLTVLRPCLVLGPTVSGPAARLIEAPCALTVDGYESPAQAVHEDDAARALAYTVDNDLPGVYNVAANDWVDQDEAVALLGQRRVVVDRDRASRRIGVLSQLGLVGVPAGALPFLLYPCVASNEKLVQAGFEFRHTAREAIRSAAEARREWVSVRHLHFRPRRIALAAGTLGVVALGSAVRSRLTGRDESRREELI